jgi:hypothetical protein
MAILTPAPANFQQKIRSELTEGLQLGYADIIPSVLHLRVTMSGTNIVNKVATTLPIPASDIYRVGGDYNFLIGEIRAHLALNGVSTEATGGDFAGMMDDTTVKGRMIAKALNAKVSLFNADRNDLRFVENNIQNSSVGGPLISDLCLGSIMPLAGGSSIKLIQKGYIMPLIVPGNERLQMKVTLTDPGASTGATEYGLTCIGALVRMRAG